MNKRTYRSPAGVRRAKQQKSKAILLLVVTFVGIVLLGLVGKKVISSKGAKSVEASQVVVQEVSGQGQDLNLEGAPPLDVQLLTVNDYSRPQIKLEKVRGIVIHYTANPGSTAQANRNYFENLKDEQTTKASSHFIVGLEGEVIQCIPSAEIAYASNDRNSDTLAIESCHPDGSGKYNEATYQSMVELTGWLCKRFDLKSSDVIRHYDITGKDCPKYFVENQDAWEQFLQDIEKEIKK